MITTNCFLSRNKFIFTIERIFPPVLFLFLFFIDVAPIYFIASIGEQFIAIFTGFWLLIIVVASEKIVAIINTPREIVPTSLGAIVGFKECNSWGIIIFPTIAEQTNPNGIPIVEFHNICLYIIFLIWIEVVPIVLSWPKYRISRFTEMYNVL